MTAAVPPGSGNAAGQASAGQAERERFAAKMEMLADWFDADDFAKGREGRTEVQQDLRRWAAAARDLAAREPDAADGASRERRALQDIAAAISEHDEADVKYPVELLVSIEQIAVLALVASALNDPQPAPASADKPESTAQIAQYPSQPAPSLGTAWRLLGELRASIDVIATGLQQRADVNRPSKVTEICDGIAASLRKLLEGK